MYKSEILYVVLQKTENLGRLQSHYNLKGVGVLTNRTHVKIPSVESNRNLVLGCLKLKGKFIGKILGTGVLLGL